MSVAFFDVDDTILKGSSGIFLAKYLVFEKGELASPSYLIDVVKALIEVKSGAVEYDSIVEKGLEQFAGRPMPEMESMCQGCFDKYIRKSIFKLAYREIINHQSAGRKVVLLTASIQPLIDIIGDFLGVDESIALKPLFEHGALTAKAERPFCYAEGKLILAREYIQEYGYDLKDCYFYSDSCSDLPLMEKVGHPRPTNPDPTLRRIALRKNWRMHFFNSVLPPDFIPLHWR